LATDVAGDMCAPTDLSVSILAREDVGSKAVCGETLAVTSSHNVSHRIHACVRLNADMRVQEISHGVNGHG
jgi:hypothetical protein